MVIKNLILEMLVSNCCRCGEKNKKNTDFKACSNFGGQRKTTCPCFKNNSRCTENCRCCGCENKFGKRSLCEGNETIVPRKRFRVDLHHHKKDSTEDYLLRHGMEVVQGKWSDFENVFLFVVVSFLREIVATDVTLENIYKFFNAAEKHLVIDEKYKVREKSIGQISSKIPYCKKLI